MKPPKNFKTVIHTFKKMYVQIPLEKVGKLPYNNLIATVLSPRTKDEITYSAFLRLKRLAGGFNQLSKANQNKLAKTIYPVAFYNVKAKRLIQIAKEIQNKLGGKVPDTIEGLTKLPGVGRKVANIVLSGTFGKNAISVDTHVHRITNMLGWVKTKTPEKTEAELMKIIPKKHWSEINKLFVSIGRQFNSKRKLKEFINSIK